MLTQLSIRVTGTAPLMMHSTQGMNPRDTLVKELKAVTKKPAQRKTDEDYEEIQRLEFLLGIYHHPTDGPYIPAEMLLAVVRDGGKANKMGKEISRSVFLDRERLPLQYKGPRDLAGLWDNSAFSDVRAAKVGKAQVMRTRPKFDEWAFDATLHYDNDHLEDGQLRRAIETAGSRVGLGDFRPRFGRFEVAFN
jgi:hypothetical protein